MTVGQWLVRQTADDTVHTVPLDDVTVHEFTAACACGPGSLETPTEDGTGRIVVHHSLDGREQRETR